MNNSNPHLRKTHKMLKKIAKKLGNPDLYYSAQIGIDSTKDSNVVTYAAMIEAPKSGLAPVTFAAFTKEEFMQKLDDFYHNRISPEQVEEAFLEAQIDAATRSIQFHQEKLEALRNPKPAEEASGEAEEPGSGVAAEGTVVKGTTDTVKVKEESAEAES